MKRDKKDTEFATDESTKQSNIKKPNVRDEHTEPTRPPGDVRNAKKSKSTSL
ncbi:MULTISPECIES: hypothetical protein [Lysinibacillus]|uniref:hypothetical protein n=1 Tax=Lysinibacillus TaxID=400634 RepID=UPI000A82DA88|nr:MULTISPECIES: hypothetical protein [Lysinibacillus]